MKLLSHYARSHWSIGVFRWEYVNMVVTFQIRAYFQELFSKNNRALFPCLQSLILTLGGLGEFSKVMQIREVTVSNSANPLRAV